MFSPALVTYTVLIIAIVLLLTDRFRADWIALSSMLILGLSDVLNAEETFSGFSRSAVITLLAIFVLAEGLRRTGVTDRVGRFLARLAGKDETRLALFSMFAGALLSLVMNNIAAASVLLPAVTSAARKLRANPGKLLMPLAFGTCLGGMATLLTTANIIVSGVLRERNLPGFGLLDFAPLGLPAVGLGIAYMALVGMRLLPKGAPTYDTGSSSLVDIYQLEERMIRVRITPDSPLIGLTLAESLFRQEFNLNLISIERQGEPLTFPTPSVRFQAGDILLMEGKIREVVQKDFRHLFEIMPRARWREDDYSDTDMIVVEVLPAPRSSLIGKTLRSAHFREKYNLNVLGIYRSGKSIRTGLSDLRLQFGDALLLYGPHRQVQILYTESELIVLGSDKREEPPNLRRSWQAVVIMLGTLILGALPQLSIAEIMLGGALLMVASGVLTMDHAYQAIEWRSLFLVAGMLPLGTALSKTGIANDLANGMLSTLGQAGPYALLAGLMLVAILLCQVMHSGVVAAILAPIGIEIALHTGTDPRAMSMAIALAASMTFLTPLGHPVNILVMSPGGYRFNDFLRVGLPMTVLLYFLILALMPFTWPLTF